MAINFTKQVRDKACAENNATNTEAGQLASPQLASGIVIKSVCERQPVLSLLGNATAGQCNTTAPGSLGNRAAVQVGKELPDSSRPNLPLSTKLVRKIDRLVGDDDRKNGRSLLRLHGNNAAHDHDTLAPLNITWLIAVDQPVAPGELSRATPPPGLSPVAAPPLVPGGAAPQFRKRDPMTPAEAFFQYPGPGAENLGYGEWVQSHPLLRMFRQVYPLHDAVGALGQPVEMPLHTVLSGGIHEALSFSHSLMELCERADSSSREFETLYRNAIEVSHRADGLLRKQADFFSRFFSALVAIGTQTELEEKARIIEILRQEWLETDFNTLSGGLEANPHQAHWQAAEPARTQVSGRRTLVDAMGYDSTSPRKRQKTDHHQEASTTASGEQLASARQTPASPRHASPRTSDADSDAELSPPLEGDRSPVKTRSLSWRSTTLKRKSRMTERPFKAWLANIPAREVSASSGPAQQSSAQQAGDPPVSGAAAITPAESHGKRLSD